MLIHILSLLLAEFVCCSWSLSESFAFHSATLLTGNPSNHFQDPLLDSRKLAGETSQYNYIDSSLSLSLSLYIYIYIYIYMYIYIYIIMIINKYILYIFNPWKILFCNLRFLEFITTFVRQLRRCNEIEILIIIIALS